MDTGRLYQTHNAQNATIESVWSSTNNQVVISDKSRQWRSL